MTFTFSQEKTQLLKNIFRRKTQCFILWQTVLRKENVITVFNVKRGHNSIFLGLQDTWLNCLQSVLNVSACFIFIGTTMFGHSSMTIFTGSVFLNTSPSSNVCSPLPKSLPSLTTSPHSTQDLHQNIAVPIPATADVFNYSFLLQPKLPS